MTEELRKRIADTITRGRVMLFMKGNPAMPPCGFSAAVVGILKQTGVPFDSYNILDDQELRPVADRERVDDLDLVDVLQIHAAVAVLLALVRAAKLYVQGEILERLLRSAARHEELVLGHLAAVELVGCRAVEQDHGAFGGLCAQRRTLPNHALQLAESAAALQQAT